MTRLIRFGSWGALLAALALTMVSSGVIPLAASKGHWAITEWLLHFTMRRTVIARSLGTTTPALDDPALVLRGAAHFETGCRPCHGAPGSPEPVVLRNMTPRPPPLPERVLQWEPDELFWIVKHGIKFTGMPGWPATEREDEVWAMVAFLLELPELTQQEYRRLAQGEEALALSTERSRLEGLGQEIPDTVLSNCGRCHGMDGQGRGAGAFPHLAAQSEAYLNASLEAYASGRRRSGVMQPVAAALSGESMRELSRYYAGLPPPLARMASSDEEAISRGEAVARDGLPSRRLPSCADCHGPTTKPRKPAYPRLAGQHAGYLVLQLQLFQLGLRGGTDYAHLMDPVAPHLTTQQMREVALYYASLEE